MMKCSSDEFACRSKNQCIPSNAVCDGIQVRRKVFYLIELISKF